MAGGVAEVGDEGGLGVAGDVADGGEAQGREDLAGSIADAPEAGDGEGMEECQQLVGDTNVVGGWGFPRRWVGLTKLS